MAFIWGALPFDIRMEFNHYMVGLLCFCGRRGCHDVLKYFIHVPALFDFAESAKTKAPFFCDFRTFYGLVGTL